MKAKKKFKISCNPPPHPYSVGDDAVIINCVSWYLVV